MPDEDIITPEPEVAPLEGEPEVPETPAPEPLTDEQKLEIAREVAQNQPDALSHYFTPPPAQPRSEPKELPPPSAPVDHFADITDEYGNVDGVKLAKAQKAANDELTQNLMAGMTNMLAPVMQSFATQKAVSGLPDEVRPFAEQVADKLGLPLYQAANDPDTMEFIRDAAYGKAFKAGKLNVTLPDSAEPIGGGGRSSTFTALEQSKIQEYARISGVKPTFALGDQLRKEGLL